MIPNMLTTVRLALVPVFAYLMFQNQMGIAAIVFVLSGLTDVVDGIIARRFNMITNFGMVYDPFVDKLMQITAIVCLVLKDIIPFWLLIFVLFKEVSMIIIGGILYLRRIVVSSNKYGKAATVIFYASVFCLIVWKSMPYYVTMFVVLLMIISMLYAAMYYIVDTIKHYDDKRICEEVKYK